MEKALVTKLLTSNQANISDITQFIHQYVLEEKNKEPTVQEINGIITLINNGLFDIRYALLVAARKINLIVLTAIDSNNNILKTYVYEPF